MQAPGSIQLPDYLGFGWLDRASIGTDERRVEVDYVNGEDLVYRVRRDEASRWSIAEYLDLGPVRTVGGPSLAQRPARWWRERRPSRTPSCAPGFGGISAIASM